MNACASAEGLRQYTGCGLLGAASAAVLDAADAAHLCASLPLLQTSRAGRRPEEREGRPVLQLALSEGARHRLPTAFGPIFEPPDQDTRSCLPCTADLMPSVHLRAVSALRLTTLPLRAPGLPTHCPVHPSRGLRSPCRPTRGACPVSRAVHGSADRRQGGCSSWRRGAEGAGGRHTVHVAKEGTCAGGGC